MKYFVLFVLLFFHFSLKAQLFCIDSSSHIQYVTQDNDSLHILKTILTKDSSKISIGYFLKKVNGRDDKFIFKINKKGEMVWFKNIKSIAIGDEFELGTIEEASNGNLFIGCLRFFAASRYFFYLIFSPSGQLIYQNSITLTNNDIDLTDAGNLSFSLISKFGSDSVLCLLSHPVIRGTFEPNSFTLVTVSNNGNIGQSHTFVPTFADSYPMYSNFAKCKIEYNTIFLYGSAEFNNICQINLREHLAYTLVKIDWTSKQIIENKAYCSPISGHDVFGYPILDGISHTQIAFLSNGNTVYYQGIYGYEINGSDSVANLFKVSEFSPLFTPLREEYVCSKKIYYNQTIRDHKLFIDSSGNRFVSLYTLDGYKAQYAVGTNQGSYLLQKTIQFPTHDNDYQFDLYESTAVEKGYFITFDIVSHTNKNTYIDNFRLMAKDTSAECFGTNENIFFNKPAYGSSIIWDGTYTSQYANILSMQPSYFIEDYPMQTNIVCNIINKCDTIKIKAPSVVCDISQPVLITAHKNPLCKGKIKFVFDTAQVSAYSQPNDTTLQLSFTKSYKGKIYAQPSSCSNLIDSATIIVNAPQPKINLGNDTLFCPGSTYLLNAYNPNFISYQWQNGQTDSIIRASAPGTYSVTARDNCNRAYKDTILIKPSYYTLKIEKDTTICLSESVVLKATANYLNYQWSPNTNLTQIASNIVEVSPQATIKYYLKAEKFKGCYYMDTVEVKVENCPQYIYFPTSFTPNNDNLNDYFKPLIKGALKKYSLIIYNRWGEIIFATANKNMGWDGFYKNILQQSGVFVWKCEYQFFDRPLKMMKGTLMLIR